MDLRRWLFCVHVHWATQNSKVAHFVEALDRGCVVKKLPVPPPHELPPPFHHPPATPPTTPVAADVWFFRTPAICRPTPPSSFGTRRPFFFLWPGPRTRVCGNRPPVRCSFWFVWWLPVATPPTAFGTFSKFPWYPGSVNWWTACFPTFLNVGAQRSVGVSSHPRASLPWWSALETEQFLGRRRAGTRQRRSCC